MSPSRTGRQPGRCRGDEGASLVEYALLLALIALVALGAVKLLGGNVGTSLSRSNNSIVQATGG